MRLSLLEPTRKIIGTPRISRNDALRERDANAEFLYAARMHQAFQLLPPGAVKQVANLLAAYDEGTPDAGLRNFEWHYLKRSLHGERLTLTGHKGEVYSVAFSPGGRFLASAAEDGLIKLSDPASGQELRSIVAHRNCANDLSFSPDGGLLASASCDHTVKIWDTATWREVSSFMGGPQALMTSVAFSPDGRYIAAGDNRSGNVFVWEVTTGTQIAQLPPNVPGVDGLAWSPDGRLLATTARGDAKRVLGDGKLANRASVAEFDGRRVFARLAAGSDPSRIWCRP